METGGQIEVVPNRQLQVTFDRRCHNPILREAALDANSRRIPWLKNFRVTFDYQ